MKKNTCSLLLILSFAFNIAFIGMLGYRMIRETRQKKDYSSGWKQSSVLYDKLSEEKKTELDSIRGQFRSEIWPMHKKMAEVRISIFNEIQKSRPDSSVINNKIEELTEWHALFEKKASYQLLQEKNVFPDSLQQSYMDYFSRRMSRSSRSSRKTK